MMEDKKELKKVDTLVPLTLEGLDGNALNILGQFSHAARSIGTPKDQIDAVMEEAMSGDYNHLLVTIMSNTQSVFEIDD